MGAVRLPKILVLTIDDFVSAQGREAALLEDLQGRHSGEATAHRAAPGRADAARPAPLRLLFVSYQDYHMCC